jgi:hypothetical protein
MKDPRTTTKFTEAESDTKPMPMNEVMALKLRYQSKEEREQIELMYRLAKNRESVNNQKAVASESMHSEQSKKLKWTFDDLFIVLMILFASLVIFFVIINPQNPKAGEKMWLLIAIPWLALFFYWVFRFAINKGFWLLADIVMFFWRLLIQVIKLAIRGLCGVLRCN